MKKVYVYSSPVGKLGIDVDEKGLRKIEFLKDDAIDVVDGDNELVMEVKRQLNEYFRGERKTFDLPLALCGTPFQLKVWEALQTIPYGDTRSYKEIADILHISIKKVDKELQKATAKLRESLKDYLSVLVVFFTLLEK